MMSLYPSPPPPPNSTSAAASSVVAEHHNNQYDAFAAALSRQRSASGSETLAPPIAKRARSSDRSLATSAALILGDWQNANASSQHQQYKHQRTPVVRSSTLFTLRSTPSSFELNTSSSSAPSFQSHVANVARPIAFRASTAPTSQSQYEAETRFAVSRGADVVGSVAAGFAGMLGPESEMNANTSSKLQTASSVVNAPKHAASSSVPDVATKDRFVAGLVGASVLAIESIWGSTPIDPANIDSGVLPLHWFVKEVLRRSRTSCSTLQLALYYLHKSRRDIREAVAKADASREECNKLEQQIKAERSAAHIIDNSYPSPPMSPISDAGSASTDFIQDRLASLLECQSSPVLCGRRMFLAALIAASKYLQDRNYSNRAWSRISGLPVNEINSNERAFLNLAGFDLHLPAADFRKWTERLAALTTQGAQIEQAATQARIGLGLARTQSEYTPVVDQPNQDLMRPSASAVSVAPGTVARRAPINVSGRSRSENSLHFAQKKKDVEGGSFQQARQFAPQPHMASPPDSDLSSGDDDHSAQSSVIAGRKVRGLPLRRSQGSKLSLRSNGSSTLSSATSGRWH